MESSSAGRANEAWERSLEEDSGREDDDLQLSEYYFRKTGVKIFSSGRMMTGFESRVDLQVDLERDELLAIRLPCSHIIVNPKPRGKGYFRLSEMENFARLHCNMPVVKEYPSCGHKLAVTCTRFRELGGESALKICPFRCERQDMKYCGHPCLKRCGEDCFPCASTRREPVATCPRKHYTEVNCSGTKFDANAKMEMRCMEMIFPTKSWPSCGHGVRVKCYEADQVTVEQVDRRCEIPCQTELKCGHMCSGRCKDCYGFRLHKKCAEKCSKILICDHKCIKTCGEGCGPCGSNCFRMCTHKSCPLECGVPCGKWECDEPCVYACQHGKCTMKCGEPCNKAPCQEPCPLKISDCGHACVGFCGEICPPCKICSPEKLAPGALLTLGELEEGQRFIHLTLCGHNIESEFMDQWMKTRDEDEQIYLKRCPICRFRLSWMFRYSDIMKANWEAIESVKMKIFGDERKIEEALERIEKRARELSATKHAFYPKFLDLIWNRIDRDASIGCRRSDMSFGAVRWIEWILEEWVYASSQVVECRGMQGIDDDIDDVEGLWQSFYGAVGRREWPFEDAEMIEYFREKQRLEDYTKVCRVLKEARSRDYKVFSKTFPSAFGRQNFDRVMVVLKDSRSYDPACQEMFEEAFKKLSGQMKVTLAISEQERIGIVGAFGGGETGRWFKCPNGHVYVITECAGAVSVGRCPECKEWIGGTQHRVLENNYLAMEMDGAVEPAYDRVVRRDQERIREVLRRNQEAIRLAVRRNQEEARQQAQQLAVRLAREDAIRRIRGAVAAAARGRGGVGH